MKGVSVNVEGKPTAETAAGEANAAPQGTHPAVTPSSAAK